MNESLNESQNCNLKDFPNVEFWKKSEVSKRNLSSLRMQIKKFLILFSFVAVTMPKKTAREIVVLYRMFARTNSQVLTV